MTHKSFPVFESGVAQRIGYCGFTSFNIGVCFKITVSASKYTCSLFSHTEMEAESFFETSFTICYTIGVKQQKTTNSEMSYFSASKFENTCGPCS